MRACACWSSASGRTRDTPGGLCGSSRLRWLAIAACCAAATTSCFSTRADRRSPRGRGAGAGTVAAAVVQPSVSISTNASGSLPRSGAIFRTAAFRSLQWPQSFNVYASPASVLIAIGCARPNCRSARRRSRGRPTARGQARGWHLPGLSRPFHRTFPSKGPSQPRVARGTPTARSSVR